MKTYLFRALLLNSQWQENCYVSVDGKGIITQISSESLSKNVEKIDAFALPGFQNAHSHAFQYAMAGLPERQTEQNSTDNFWSWREAMYTLALKVNPDQMEAIATMLYAEMARHGYTNVAEFHYLHHDVNGEQYINLAEMGSRLVAAAKTVGIGITLIPIFYQKGGFGQEPNERQRRFISKTSDDYLKLLEASKQACYHYERASIGMGIHSLRAVDARDCIEIDRAGPQELPFHIHVAEQLKEIEDSIAFLKKRPVEWLLDNIELTNRFHLVHATHLNPFEISGITSQKANVVLCPSTEGNLGDGLFSLAEFQYRGGSWSIGTDSHVGLNPFEELRLLDYGQRLKTHQRNTFHYPEFKDSGTFALNMWTTAGRKAMGNYEAEFFKIGEPLNACLMGISSPLLANTSIESLTATMVYTSDSSMQQGAIAFGKQCLNPDKYNQIRERFKSAIRELKNR